jgi:hypothetical protein
MHLLFLFYSCPFVIWLGCLPKPELYKIETTPDSPRRKDDLILPTLTAALPKCLQIPLLILWETLRFLFDLNTRKYWRWKKFTAEQNGGGTEAEVRVCEVLSSFFAIPL